MTTKAIFSFILLAGILSLSACKHREVEDDFAKLKKLQADLVQLSVDNPRMYLPAQLDTKIVNGQVIAITIIGRGMNQLLKSIYQFHQLTELIMEQTDFQSLPDLKPLTNLKILVVEYNLFKGPVHLRKLPASLESLILNRDSITEVIVDDSLPNLSSLSLTQNRMNSRINSTFCKLPKLNFLDLSSGCCNTESQSIALENAAKKLLCKKDIAVKARGSFID